MLKYLLMPYAVLRLYFLNRMAQIMDMDENCR